MSDGVDDQQVGAMTTAPDSGDPACHHSHDYLGPGACKLSVMAPDVDAGYPEPCRRGDRPQNEVTDAPWSRWFSVGDPDGNNWLVVHSTEGA